jgi:hypothetical protein
VRGPTTLTNLLAISFCSAYLNDSFPIAEQAGQPHLRASP